MLTILVRMWFWSWLKKGNHIITLLCSEVLACDVIAQEVEVWVRVISCSELVISFHSWLLGGTGALKLGSSRTTKRANMVLMLDISSRRSSIKGNAKATQSLLNQTSRNIVRI